jgi:outer membrane lipoprotein-sorting protein
MKMKRFSTVLTAIIALLCVSPAPAIKFDFTTVSDVVKSISKRYGEIDCYSASFTLRGDKGGKKTQQNGVIRSKSPDKLLVEFSNPPGQKIVANEKTMWIYMPSLNVVATQDLNNKNASFLTSNTKNGLSRLFSKYHYKFDAKDQPITEADGKKYYTLYLKQKESRSGYRNLKLWITDDYLIKKAVGETSSGKKVEIEFTNIKTNESFPNGMFKFDMPANAREIKNPMMAEE